MITFNIHYNIITFNAHITEVKEYTPLSGFLVGQLA
jgi:hypothetical protein